MDFSLILPSRERTELLGKFLSSVKTNTHNLNEIEVLVAVDKDDQETVYTMPTLKLKYPFVTFHVGQRQDNFSTGYYDKLANISKGKYIWALNDDCVFTTFGWDRLALQHFTTIQYHDGIYYCRTLDDLGKGYPCFPMLTCGALNVQDFFFHCEFRSWGADINLHEIWSTIGRVVDCPMLTVKHLTHHNGSRERDHVNLRVGHIASYNWGCAKGEANRIRNIITAQKVLPAIA